MTSPEYEDEINVESNQGDELVDLIPVSKILERQQMLLNRVKKKFKTSSKVGQKRRGELL